MASSRPKTRSATDHRLVGQEEREEKERAKVVKEILEKEAGSGYIDMSSESGGAGVTQQTLKSPWSLSRNKLLQEGRGGERGPEKPKQSCWRFQRIFSR